MPYTILWIEDEYMDALYSHLAAGYSIIRAYSVSEAEDAIHREASRIDLVLLDLMMDLDRPDLDRGYTADNTSQAYRTGLEFYRRNRERLQTLGIAVLVYTILGNHVEVRDEFIRLGLPAENYLDKRRTANVHFVEGVVQRVLRGREPRNREQRNPAEPA